MLKILNGYQLSYVVEIRNCTKRLVSSDHEFELAIDHVGLERHSFLGFVGRSGSGKSTFLDLLSLVSKPDAIELYRLSTSGEPRDITDLIREGSDTELSAIRLQHFGYIMQTGGLIEFLNVEENINLVPSVLEMPKQDKDSELVRQLEMQSHLNKRTSQLSGGQRQRVSILRALASNPSIVVADEPTAAIDERMAEVIVKELKDLAKQTGATVVVVSHDLELVSKHCDAIVELKPRQVSTNKVMTRISVS